jgi:hypothetical protein
LKGIATGETIVVEGTQKLHDKTEVKVISSQKPVNK